MTTPCNKCGAQTTTYNGTRGGKPRIKRYCPECQKRRLKQYSSSEGKRAWDHRNKEKRSAHKQVELAMLRGEISRQPCERCHSPNAQAHHEDYSKPLDVAWLCSKHHAERHKEIRKEKMAADPAGATAS